MKRSRFTEEQVIAVLREHMAGEKAADLCRKADRYLARHRCGEVESGPQPARRWFAAE
jgi:hypothetical protein